MTTGEDHAKQAEGGAARDDIFRRVLECWCSNIGVSDDADTQALAREAGDLLYPPGTSYAFDPVTNTMRPVRESRAAQPAPGEGEAAVIERVARAIYESQYDAKWNDQKEPAIRMACYDIACVAIRAARGEGEGR